MNAPRLITTNFINETRGSLLALEAFETVPFAIARAFIVSNVPAGEPRGVHAHRQCEQFLVCLQGSVSALAETGSSRETFELSTPQHGLYLPPYTWGTQSNHSTDAILLVLASEPYDPNDYIHDHDEFLELVGTKS